MNKAAGSEMLLNCEVFVLGPLTTDQAPVPAVGVLAPSVALIPSQIVCGLPALAIVGGAFTDTCTALEARL